MGVAFSDAAQKLPEKGKRDKSQAIEPISVNFQASGVPGDKSKLRYYVTYDNLCGIEAETENADNAKLNARLQSTTNQQS